MTSCTWELLQALPSLSTHESLSPGLDAPSTDVASTDRVHMVILQELPTDPPQGPGKRQRLPQLDEKESQRSSKSLWRYLKSPSDIP